MSIAFRISLVVTAILVAASVGVYLWLKSIWATSADSDSFGVIFLILLTLLVTAPSFFVTLGIWIAQKNRKASIDNSLHL